MTFTLGFPQIIWIVLSLFGVMYATATDGEEIKQSGMRTLAAVFIELIILYWGGFFG